MQTSFGGSTGKIKMRCLAARRDPGSNEFECNSTGRFGFLNRWRPEISLSLRANGSDTSTIVLFTRVRFVVLQCVCSLQLYLNDWGNGVS